MIRSGLLGFLALVISAGLSVTAEGADMPAVKLLLRYDSETEQLELTSQELVDVAPPQHRKTAPQAGELVLECQNAAKETLAQIPIQDPSILRAEWSVNPTAEGAEAGRLTGETRRLKETEFVVVVPFDEHLAHVQLLKPSFLADGTVESLRSIGTCPINREQLQSFVEEQRGGRNPSP